MVDRPKSNIKYLLKLRAVCRFCGLREVSQATGTCFSCGTTIPDSPLIKKGKQKNVPSESDS